MKDITNRYFVLWVCILIPTFYLNAQNVGINTSTPGATLEIKGFSNTSTENTLKITNSSSTEVLTILDNGRLGLGKTAPSVRLDLRGTSENPVIGIGTTNNLASAVGGGAIRYMDGTKELHYSDGEQWFRLQSNALRPCVIAPNDYNAGSYPNITTTRLTGYEPVYDSHGAFNQTNSVYTAPIDGMYVVAFTLSFARTAISTNTYIEGRWVSDNGNSLKCIQAYSETGTGQAGLTCSGTIQLYRGDTVWPEVWHNLGGTRAMRVFGVESDRGFNRLSIFAQ
ncbi:hypothetical protein [Dysgonomonas macrotermitis]|uniref:C1q domain-containing protein n=1 Tax=Dysgonomonas macrotermitis TaxID=1346286 RepID=A0A1M5CGN0_9BACT|nr:hypothetical protein [Dysgonomonas macrotermitis]SHF53757.1 hypothetical protein SAMN05444362_107160 [Dysgonomonas macrotermitis]